MEHQYLKPGEPLPEDHVCRCYGCAGGKTLPPDESVSLAEAARGHFKVGSFPLCERVEVDGAAHTLVVECQAGEREPWAAVVSEPVHPCRACDSGRPCTDLIFPKRVEATVHEAQRELYEQVRARELAREGA